MNFRTLPFMLIDFKAFPFTTNCQNDGLIAFPSGLLSSWKMFRLIAKIPPIPEMLIHLGVVGVVSRPPPTPNPKRFCS